jgi:hypothetical protein
MSTIDDPAIIGRIDVGLGTKFEAKVFDDIYKGQQLECEPKFEDLQAGGRASD